MVNKSQNIRKDSEKKNEKDIKILLKKKKKKDISIIKNVKSCLSIEKIVTYT